MAWAAKSVELESTTFLSLTAAADAAGGDPGGISGIGKGKGVGANTRGTCVGESDNPRRITQGAAPAATTRLEQRKEVKRETSYLIP